MPPLRNTGQAPEAERPEYAGRYLLESDLGSGGMGAVHLATSASGLRLAVKIIHSNHASDPEFRARFRQEIAAARRVSGAFTAPVVDADPEAERPWMATLFIDGPTLSERVKRSGPLGTDELIQLGAGLAEGLRDIHRAGVVHRDLKPSNVLLAADGPKVIDFGISRPSDSDLHTETGRLIGTPPFMAPEQFQRPREVGPAADVFAMGAVLVHAATGRGPFDSDSPYIVAYQVVHDEPDLSGVPEGLLPLIARCLAKEPADRPTPDELMAALRTDARGVDRRGADATRGTVTALVPPSRAHRTGGGDPTPTTHPKAGRSRAGRPWTVLSLTRRRPRARWAAIGVVLAVVTGAGLVGMHAAGDGTGAAPAKARADRVGAAGREFRPWDLQLRGGTGENRMSVCTADGTGVYCAAPGIKAARLDPVNGRLAWSSGDTATAKTGVGGAAPFLSGGLLHVITANGGRLEALDPASGKKRWGADLSAYPVVRHAGDSVLLVSPGGVVRSLDSATGRERWKASRGGPGSLWVATPATPATPATAAAAARATTAATPADGDKNRAGAGGELFAVSGSSDGTSTQVTSVDPATGATRWEQRITGTLTPVSASDGALYLLAGDLDSMTVGVVRLDTATRDVRRVPLSSPLDQAQATVDGGTVYLIGYSGSLVAVDTGGKGGSGAAERWRLETSVAWTSAPVVLDGRLYLSAGDGRLLAVDARRGVLVGETKPRMDDGRHTFTATLAAPVAVPGRVYASAPDGSVFAVDSRDPSRW
ncbi:protein kinase domain-containing protein [Streptomyces liangshanensis]|uniref:PQQ-binding-like beta-propeller repeat protein n=1 Tax=Streptomyces liangshanensis TaxID=2717324 RepID=A0A6G9GYT5_9ACTN|nr:serine/threonine-protein kinase [Streptomyces liangshanensis]QIQ03380.1 PQQ-binding-like beta-propeller repeat protein [Streptomyces liangshanensis]